MWLFHENFSVIWGNNYGVNEINTLLISFAYTFRLRLSANCAAQLNLANGMTALRENNTVAETVSEY